MKLTKRKLIGILAATCVASSAISVGATNLVIKIQAEMRNDYTITVEGEKLDTKGQGAISYNNTTYLPVRLVSEAVGKAVSWDQTTKTVNIGGQLEQKPTTLMDLKFDLDSGMTLSKNPAYIADGEYSLHLGEINSAFRYARFDLDKKYTTFSARAINTGDSPVTLTIFDQNDISLYEAVIAVGDEQSITVNITGATKLRMLPKAKVSAKGSMDIIDGTLY